MVDVFTQKPICVGYACQSVNVGGCECMAY